VGVDMPYSPSPPPSPTRREGDHRGISCTMSHLSFSPAVKPSRQNPPTWKDPKTGLEWQCQSPGRMTWHEAQEYAACLSLDCKTDWRLPTLAELESLLDRTRARSDGRPRFREEIPFRDNLSYWSSTTFERHTKTAWIVMFDGAYVLSYYKSNSYHVRCVRG
jgi:formylglycine-generating enzyme required for sulfatase activity